ncbi:N-succinyldiaminopimelate aminotransferase, partial [Staphylococcus ureilyticus]
SEAFEQMLLKEQSILVAPGIPFGDNGKYYVRLSLALSEEQLETAAKRLSTLTNLYEK